MSQPDWQPTASIPAIRARAKLLREIREFFDSRGFVEVDTPLLSADTIVDRYIDPLRVPTSELQLPFDADVDGFLFLQTSPEFAMKRLLAAGSGPIYQICKAFRSGESGPTHNPEFTMLEWYDTRLDYPSCRKQLGNLVCTVLRTDGFDQLSYREVFLKFTGIDPFKTDNHSLRAYIQSESDFQFGSHSESTDDLLNIILSEAIQPKLGAGRPVIVFDWPESQAALAKTSVRGETVVAERFEIYCRGIELANGYCELLDAEQLVNRARINNAVRKEIGKPEFPESSRLVDAMRAGMPECCGVALGVDRLLMLQLGVASINEVISFPIDRA